MVFHKLTLLLGLAGILFCNNSRAVTTIISDTFNISDTNSGFALNMGVNAGINPPATRLTGTSKANLRYIQTDTEKPSTAYTIKGNELRVDAAGGRGRFVLSADGVNSFDFGSALGIGSASRTNRVVYDLSIRINNNSATTERFAVALGTAEGDVNSWNFAVQVYRTNSGNNFYTIGKRIDTASSGLTSDLNEHITSLTGNSYGGDLTILMRVTDAGAETTTFNSRIQLSLNGGNSWIYDTDTDPSLPNGWRLNGPERHIMWDIAPDAGPITFDAFSVKLNPPLSNLNTSSVFKVIQYNIHYAAQDGKINTQRIANFILDQRADLVSLNEVDSDLARSNNRYLIKELSEETGMEDGFGNNNPHLSGNAVLSKYPILYRERILLPNVGDNEQRGLMKTVIDVNGKFICFWSTHLDFHADDTERLMCVTNFNMWVTNETLPVILCGDFNDTPGGAAPTLMEQKWIDIWDVAGDGTAGRTVPCPGVPGKRIDYIWKAKTSANLTPTNAFVDLNMQASDHYPVLTQFIFNNFTNHAAGFYFPFDQGSGTKVADTVAGLSGTFGASGPTWSTDSPTSLAGDYSLYFDGTKKISVIDTNQIIGTNGMDDSYTLQVWVKLPLNYAPSQRAVLFQYERKPGFSISINTNRTLHTSSFKRDFATSAAIPNDGQWHHVAVVHNDGANMKFYIDRTLAQTVSYTGGAGNRTDTLLTIGSASKGANPFTGYLDRLKFDECALLPAEFDFPAVPPLGIRKNGNLLTLFWPAGMTSYTLQSNGSLETNGWVSVASQLQGNELQANVAPTNSAKFFRLKRQ
jgi:endonuclease/exonuclease/phosphatase family metal-dependent hydrolase